MKITLFSFFPTGENVIVTFGNTYLTEGEERAMWRAIIIIGVREICVEDRPWIYFANCHQSSLEAFSSPSRACTPTSCPLPAPFHPPSWQKKSEIPSKESVTPSFPSASLLPPAKTERLSSFESSSSFVSIQETERVSGDGPELLLERVAAPFERLKPWRCQVRRSNCYQMYNYIHLEPPRPLLVGKEKREINYLAK